MTGHAPPGFIDRLAAGFTATSAVDRDVHMLFVLGCTSGPRSAAATTATAAALRGIVPKLAARGATPADQVPAILEALADRLRARDPNLAAELPAPIVAPPAETAPLVASLGDAAAAATTDAARGAVVYRERRCQACHGGPRRIGPDLGGITSRFSREDLFLHIVEPNRSISPAYQPLVVTTQDGRAYLGIPVYRSAASLLLQTAAETTVRIRGDEAEQIRPAATSFMPAGLLDGATDGDLADLQSYLKSLGRP
jgi:putative heme-binding domain-containing protein